MAESDFLPRVTATGPETRVVEMNPRWNSTAKPASTWGQENPPGDTRRRANLSRRI